MSLYPTFPLDNPLSIPDQMAFADEAAAGLVKLRAALKLPPSYPGGKTLDAAGDVADLAEQAAAIQSTAWRIASNWQRSIARLVTARYSKETPHRRQDLFQEGYQGAYNGVLRWRPTDSPAKFKNCIQWGIGERLQSASIRGWGGLTTPRDDMRELWAVRRCYGQHLGAGASRAEATKATVQQLGIEIGKVQFLLSRCIKRNYYISAFYLMNDLVGKDEDFELPAYRACGGFRLTTDGTVVVDQIEAAQRAELLHRCLDELSEPERLLLEHTHELRGREFLAAAGVARKLGCSVDTAKMLRLGATRKLRARLAQHLDKSIDTTEADLDARIYTLHASSLLLWGEIADHYSLGDGDRIAWRRGKRYALINDEPFAVPPAVRHSAAVRMRNAQCYDLGVERKMPWGKVAVTLNIDAPLAIRHAFTYAHRNGQTFEMVA